jgi:hypothetical protein
LCRLGDRQGWFSACCMKLCSQFSVYVGWLKQKHFPYPPTSAVITLDDASCHNIQIDRPPILNSREDTVAYKPVAKQRPLLGNACSIHAIDERRTVFSMWSAPQLFVYTGAVNTPLQQ